MPTIQLLPPNIDLTGNLAVGMGDLNQSSSGSLLPPSIDLTKQGNMDSAAGDILSPTIDIQIPTLLPPQIDLGNNNSTNPLLPPQISLGDLDAGLAELNEQTSSQQQQPKSKTKQIYWEPLNPKSNQ